VVQPHNSSISRLQNQRAEHTFIESHIGMWLHIRGEKEGETFLLTQMKHRMMWLFFGLHSYMCASRPHGTLSIQRCECPAHPVTADAEPTDPPVCKADITVHAGAGIDRFHKRSVQGSGLRIGVIGRSLSWKIPSELFHAVRISAMQWFMYVRMRYVCTMVYNTGIVI
jgi:hypothetical protein